MLVLRLTSPSSVRGVRSDDDFTIGRFTIGGTYNLLVIGAVVGIIGAGAYRMVAPWLLGPSWLRRLTVGLASGAVVGSMLIHSDGIDFTRLKPTWLAIGLFIVLPGVFGVAIGASVDAVRSPDSWTRNGKLRWVLPIVLAVCFPFILPVLIVALLVLAVLLTVDGVSIVRRVRATRPYGFLIRAGWLLAAVAGLRALLSDIDSLS